METLKRSLLRPGHRPIARFFVPAIFALAVALASPLPSPAETPPNATPERPTDFSVIANYLAVFLRYVAWPPAPEPRPAAAPVRVGVLGPNPFGKTLDRLVAGKLLHNRPLAALYTTRTDQLADCEVAFINLEGRTEREHALRSLAGKPVLTVVYLGDDTNAPATSAAIELVRIGNNIRYRLNPAVLGHQGLQPTPGLLENALPRAGGTSP